jgi:protein-disulfide isomerase
LRWVLRTFPHNEAALRAEMLARCMPRDQYLKMEDMMFANQQRWAFTSTPLPNLAMLVRVAGIDAAKFEACTTNKALEEAVLKLAQDGTEKYKIGSTPTFILNDGDASLRAAALMKLSLTSWIRTGKNRR